MELQFFLAPLFWGSFFFFFFFPFHLFFVSPVYYLCSSPLFSPLGFSEGDRILLCLCISDLPPGAFEIPSLYVAISHPPLSFQQSPPRCVSNFAITRPVAPPPFCSTLRALKDSRGENLSIIPLSSLPPFFLRRIRSHFVTVNPDPIRWRPLGLSAIRVGNFYLSPFFPRNWIPYRLSILSVEELYCMPLFPSCLFRSGNGYSRSF